MATRRSIKELVPGGARRRIRDATGLTEFGDRVQALEGEVERLGNEVRRLETQLHESRDEVWERSRERWRAAQPDAELTWAVKLTGDAMMDKVEQYGGFGEGRTVVEVGPGYGRLLTTALERSEPFGKWVGVDLSETNVEHLRGRFEDPRVEFTVADVETVEVGSEIDTIVSSLTFKHLFPSFEKGLANLARQMRAGGLVLIDLIEGERRYFEDDDVTYIRWYSRPEVEEILGRCGLELVAFDEVRHHPDAVRLLVVARRT